jgi:hypothetical protein
METSPADFAKTLNENAELLQTIIDNVELGRLQDCAKYQRILQTNLLRLVAQVDSLESERAKSGQVTSVANMRQALVHQLTPQVLQREC